MLKWAGYFQFPATLGQSGYGKMRWGGYGQKAGYFHFFIVLIQQIGCISLAILMEKQFIMTIGLRILSR